MAVDFPDVWKAKGDIPLKADRDASDTKVNYKRHNAQITTLENRDLYLLDFLSKFDALPIGSIMPTSIPYTSDTMPDGWVWANGKRYGKYETSADARPNLWNAIKDIPGAVVSMDEYLSYCTNNGYSNTEPNEIVPFGKYVDAGLNNDFFYVPTLNDIFLMSITSSNRNQRISGKYESDSIGEHTHDIVAYPVNGANLSSEADKIGVALTDQIEDDFSSAKGGNYSTKHRYTSQTNTNYSTETKPKSIAYQFMIKADYTSFSLANTVDTVCDSVQGYKPSSSAPTSLTDIMWFPVPDQTTGKIDINWLDVSTLTGVILEQSEENIVEIVNRNAVLKTDISESASSNKIPVATEEGKLDPDYFNIATNSEIDTLFL